MRRVSRCNWDSVACISKKYTKYVECQFWRSDAERPASPNIIHGVLVDKGGRVQDCEPVNDGVAYQKPVEGVAVQLRKALEEIDIGIRKRAVEKMVLGNRIRHEFLWGGARSGRLPLSYLI